MTAPAQTLEKLRACPFCDGPAGELHWPGHVGCMDKNCGGYGANLPVAQWNTRPELDRLEKLVEEARAQITRDKDQFHFYAEQHLAKTPPDFIKARTNLDRRDECIALLSRMNKETGE